MNKEKNDKLILEIVTNTINQDEKLDYMIIGGVALNMLLSKFRLSQDVDFAIRNKDNNAITRSKLKNISRLVRKNLEEEFSLETSRAENKRDAINYDFNNESYYYHSGFIYKIVLYIKGNRYQIELTADDIMHNFEIVKSGDGINNISIEGSLSVKFLMTLKKINDNSIWGESFVRHLYDVYRILNDSNPDLSKVVGYLKLVHNWELNREPKTSYDIKLEDYGIILKSFLDDENNLSKFIYRINRIFKIEIDDPENFKNKILITWKRIEDLL